MNNKKKVKKKNPKKNAKKDREKPKAAVLRVHTHTY